MIEALDVSRDAFEKAADNMHKVFRGVLGQGRGSE